MELQEEYRFDYTKARPNRFADREQNHMGVKDIKSAIAQLSSEEMAELSEWFDEYRADCWDRQIEEDAEAGRLDALIRQAEKDFNAGRFRPL